MKIILEQKPRNRFSMIQYIYHSKLKGDINVEVLTQPSVLGMAGANITNSINMGYNIYKPSNLRLTLAKGHLLNSDSCIQPVHANFNCRTNPQIHELIRRSGLFDYNLTEVPANTSEACFRIKMDFGIEKLWLIDEDSMMGGRYI